MNPALKQGMNKSLLVPGGFWLVDILANLRTYILQNSGKQKAAKGHTYLRKQSTLRKEHPGGNYRNHCKETAIVKPENYSNACKPILAENLKTMTKRKPEEEHNKIKQQQQKQQEQEEEEEQQQQQ